MYFYVNKIYIFALNIIQFKDNYFDKMNISTQSITFPIHSPKPQASFWLEVLSQHISLALLIEDKDRNVVLLNPKMRELLGELCHPILGENFWDALSSIQSLFQDEVAFKQAAKDWFEEKKMLENIHWDLKDGRSISIDFIPIMEGGDFMGAMWQFREITSLKKQEQELREAHQKSEASAKSKEVFLANMSHEIRTPMNAIMGMTNLLEKTKLAGKQKAYLAAIKISSEHLLAIINDILDVSKIEAGKLQLENIGFELYKIVANSIQSLTYLAATKSVSLSYTIDAKIAKVLKGDPIRLEQIFLNLLSNAIKFTYVGSVEIVCKLKEEDNGVQWVVCEISDTGIGIDEEKLDIIFESFTQADASTTRHFGGTGLGLTITKQLVEMMHGKISVRSKKDEGTTFTLEIPFEKGAAIDLPEKKKQVDEYKSLRGIRVLMVEDNKWNQILGTAILENWQMEVHTAENGFDALDKLKKNPYEIVLMDIQMPKMGGVEAAKAIRNDLGLKIPIIALTANAIKGDKEKYLGVGMDAYISKPFDEEELFQTLSTLLGDWNSQLKREEEKSLNGVQPFTVSMLATPLYDLSKLKHHAQGSDAFVKRMIKLFREQTTDAIAEINECYHKNDWDRIRAIAHQIKPSIDLLCIEQLRTEIRHIEKYAENKENLDEMADLIDKLNHVIKLVLAELEKE